MSPALGDQTVSLGMTTFVAHGPQQSSHIRPTEPGAVLPRRSWATLLGVGILTGAVLGVAARVFMRLLTEDPEFTWSGTLFIVGLFTVFGFVQGAVAAIRNRTTRGWITLPTRLVGGFSYLMLGGGPGVLLLPFLWFGALAFWRTGWRRWVRISLAALAAADLFGLVAITLHEEGFDRLLEPAVVAGFALLSATYCAMVWTVGPTVRGPRV